MSARSWLVVTVGSASAVAVMWGVLIPGPEGGVTATLSARFAPPSYIHWFGTDELGRDLFRRVLEGLALSLGLVSAALLGAACIGLTVGTVTGGVENRWMALAARSLTNVVWSLPSLVFLLAVTAYFGRAPAVIAGALAFTTWVPIARVAHLETLRERRRPYVTAMRAFGHHPWTIRAVMIRSTRVSIAVGLLAVALDLIAMESGLSFLGLGIQPPKASLGGLIYVGLYYVSEGWWLLAFPLAALLVIVFGLRGALAAASGERA